MMSTSVVCQQDFHARPTTSGGRKYTSLSVLHIVIISAFLTFGVLLLCLGVCVTFANEEIPGRPVSRVRRGASQDVQQVEDILPGVVLDSTSEIFVSILSDEARFAGYSLAIAETWGQDSVQYELLYGVERRAATGNSHASASGGVRGLDVGSSFGYNHLLRSVQFACDHGHYDWHIMMMDSVYLNPSALRRVLALLSPNESVLMGVSFQNDPAVCDVSLGVIFSRSSMAKICPRLELSLSPAFNHLHSISGASLALGRFLYEATGLSCFDATQLMPQFRVTSMEGQVTTHTVFIGPLTSPRSIRKAHALVIDLEIQTLQNLIIQTQGELSVYSRGEDEERDPRHKRNSVWNQSDDLVPFKTSAMQTNTFSEYINENGHLFKDACRMVSYDLINDDQSSFQAARKLAKEVDKNSMSFAYKQDKRHRGIEYNFYSIQNQKNDLGAQRVRQVSVQLSTGDLRLVKKSPIQFQDIHIVATIPEDHRHIGRFLRQVHSACEQYSNISESRCHVELFLRHKFSLLHPAHSASDVINHFRRQHPELIIDFAEHTDPTFDFILQSLSVNRNRHLYLFLPVDVYFDVNFLLRCVFNTKRRERVYFPIPLHSHDASHVDPYSFWVNKDFTIFSAHLSDILDFRAKIQDERDVYSLFRWAGFEVYRRPDPGVKRDLRNMCQQKRKQDKDVCMEELRLVNLA